jgi:2-methylcitrate dehydratase PrpD
MTSVAEHIADRAAAAHRQRLPADCAAASKRLLMNAAALVPHGSRHPITRTLVEVWPPQGGGRHRRAARSPLTVAGAVASAVNVDDYDDAHLDTLVHPACVNLAAAISVASFKHVSGAELLSAFAIGCELEIRLAIALLPEALERGWDLNGVCGTLSAAVTASLLIDPSPVRVANAIEVAASSTLGLLGGAGSPVKVYTAGKAAQNGVAAALLANARFTAPSDCFESPRGLCQALIQRKDAFESTTVDFTSFGALAGTVIKRYPCAIVLHPYLDAVRELRVSEQEVTSVRARCNPRVLQLVDRPRPADGLEAKVSAQYCLATILAEGELSVSHFEDARFVSAQAAEAQVTLVEDPSVAVGAGVIDWQTGSTPTVPQPDPQRSHHGLRDATAAELNEKVAALLASSCSAEESARLVDYLRNIDESPDIMELVRLVTGGENGDG